MNVEPYKMSDQPKSAGRNKSAEPKKSRLAALAPGENIKEKQVRIFIYVYIFVNGMKVKEFMKLHFA